MREIKETINKLNSSINIIRSEKAEMENNLNGIIDELNSIIDEKTTKQEELTEKVNYQFKILCNKEITLDLMMKERDDFRDKLDEIKQLKIKEKDEMESVLSDKLKDNQVRLTLVVDVLCSLTMVFVYNKKTLVSVMFYMLCKM